MTMILTALALVQGLTLPTAPSQAAAARAAMPARRDVIAGGAAVLAWAASSRAAMAEEEATPTVDAAPPPPPTSSEVALPNGLKYKVIKTGGKGAKPVVGDLISIRFKCVIEKSGTVIDDILNTPEPYYYRVGSGQVVPAVEQAVVMMRSGDQWELTVPPELGFGTKGRSSSPGKPRISGDAILKFTLVLDGVPGKDEEILEVNGLSD